MCSRGNLYLRLTLNGWHLNLASEDSRNDRNVEVVDKVVAVAHQLRIVLLLNNDKQVAIYTATTRSVALALYRKSHTLAYTGRYLNLNNLRVTKTTLALALVALGCDGLTLTVAVRTYRLRLHSSEEGVLHRHHITRATTS